MKYFDMKPNPIAEARKQGEREMGIAMAVLVILLLTAIVK